MAAGSIVVDLLMKTGSFETDTKRAEKALRELEKEARAVGTAIGTAFAGVTVAAALMVKSSIDTMDKMIKLAQTTGTTVEALSALAYAADLSGVGQEQLGSALVKLSKNMSDAAMGTGEAIKGFTALGISVKNADGTLKGSDKVLTEIAAKFAGFRDGAEKTAIAVNLFGKAGAELIPLLNSGAEGLEEMRAEAQQLGVVLDTETSKAAELFNDNLTRLTSAISGVANRATAELLPALVGVTEQFVALAKSMAFIETTSAIVKAAIGGLINVFQTIAVVASDVGFVFLGVGREIAAITAQIAALGRGDLTGFRAISDAVREDGKRARAELDKFQASVMAIGEKAPKFKDPRILGDPGSIASQTAGMRGPAPRMGGGGGGGRRSGGAGSGADAFAKEDAELKKRLDGQLREIRDFADQQAAAYDFANRVAEIEYSQGVTSLRSFFEAQKAIRAAALSSALEEQDKIIKAQTIASGQFKGKNSETQRIDAENKIADAVRARTAAVEKGGRDEAIANLQIGAALEQVKSRYDDLRATVFQLAGDEAKAAEIRIAAQVKEASRTVKDAGGDPGLVTQFKARLEGVESLRRAQEDYGRILERTRNTEESVLLAAQASGATEIETLKALGAARSQSLVQLGAMAARARELADALGTEDARRFADEMALGFKRAELAADPLLDRIKEIADEIADAFDFTDAITGAKSLKDVLNDIQKQVADIIIREAITKPIQEGIAGIIKGNSSSSGVGGNILGGIFGSASKWFSGFGSGASGAQISSMGAASLIPGFAAGTDFVPRDMFARVHRGERIVPASENRMNVKPVRQTVLHYHASPGESRSTSMQRMADGKRVLDRADMRNN